MVVVSFRDTPVVVLLTICRSFHYYFRDRRASHVLLDGCLNCDLLARRTPSQSMCCPSIPTSV